MASNSNRDEFSPATKRALEKQARGHCSNPACRRLTRGATSDGAGEVNIGVASHICAAAPRGPRYDANMTPEQRHSADNGIWLCDVHGRAVHAPDSKFTVEELQEWKRLTDEDSWRSIMENIPYGPGMRPPTPDALRDRLRAAPGMGKTTTVFQIAEGVLTIVNGTPLIVPLGDWATEGDALLASILKRGAFAAVSEMDFRAVAAKQAIGNDAARERLKAEILNQRQWEEAVLFAVERSARGSASMKAARSAAILAAFEVDPLLAAEMIFRATDDVWSPISATIRNFIDKWRRSSAVFLESLSTPATRALLIVSVPATGSKAPITNAICSEGRSRVKNRNSS